MTVTQEGSCGDRPEAVIQYPSADGFDLSPEGYRFTVQYLLPQKLLLLNGTVSLSWCRSNRAGSLLGWGLELYHKGLTPVPIDGTHPESRN